MTEIIGDFKLNCDLAAAQMGPQTAVFNREHRSCEWRKETFAVTHHCDLEQGGSGQIHDVIWI